jgi:hypothetical protein
MTEKATETSATYLFQEKGFFWWAHQPVPEGHFAPETAVVGELKINPEGRITLDLYSLLSNERDALATLGRSDDPSLAKQRIRGILIDSNRRVLLLDLSRRAQHHSSYRISTEGFRATYCLIGNEEFLGPTKALLLSHLEIDFKGFEEWLWLGSIRITRGRDSLTAKYKRPRQIKYILHDGTLRILHDLSGSHSLGGNTDIKMAETTHIRFTPTKKLDITQAVEWHRVLQDFVILMTDSDYSFDWPVVFFGKTHYQLYFEKLTPKASPPRRHECATNFPRISEKFGMLFSTWRAKREKFGSAFYLYLGTRRGMQLYAENRFAMLIWGIEAFHRTKYGDASGSGRTAARINLKQRIFETLKALPIGLDPERLKKFAAECAQKRNEISHFGGQRKQGGPYRDFVLALAKLSDALSYLYHALLLHEIGLDDEMVHAWIHKSFYSFRMRFRFIEVGLMEAEKPRT